MVRQFEQQSNGGCFVRVVSTGWTAGRSENPTRSRFPTKSIWFCDLQARRIRGLRSRAIQRNVALQPRIMHRQKSSHATGTSRSAATNTFASFQQHDGRRRAEHAVRTSLRISRTLRLPRPNGLPRTFQYAPIQSSTKFIQKSSLSSPLKNIAKKFTNTNFMYIKRQGKTKPLIGSCDCRYKNQEILPREFA